MAMDPIFFLYKFTRKQVFGRSSLSVRAYMIISLRLISEIEVKLGFLYKKKIKKIYNLTNGVLKSRKRILIFWV